MTGRIVRSIQLASRVAVSSDKKARVFQCRNKRIRRLRIYDVYGRVISYLLCLFGRQREYSFKTLAVRRSVAKRILIAS